MSDALLDAIVESPDDDAPRLVWADREGGERGELVVIQCRLARHDVPWGERVRLEARESELLKRHGQAWAGVPQATFRRGFVERLRIEVDRLAPKVEPLFESLPLLRALRIDHVAEVTNTFVGPTPAESWAAGARTLANVLSRMPRGRLQTLEVAAEVHHTGDWSDPGTTYHFDRELLELLAGETTLMSLRELVLLGSAVDVTHVPQLARMDLERLHLGSHRLGADGIIELLRASPRLVRLAAWAGTPRLSGHELAALLAAPEVARLKELDLLSNGLAPSDLEQIAGCAALSSLDRLGLGYAHRDGLPFIVRSPHLANLRELDLFGIHDADLALREPTFAGSLRVLRVSTDERAVFPPSLPALERFETKS